MGRRVEMMRDEVLGQCGGKWKQTAVLTIGNVDDQWQLQRQPEGRRDRRPQCSQRHDIRADGDALGCQQAVLVQRDLLEKQKTKCSH